MKWQLKKSMLGVTLLEILLVLVIASLVIVMSLRYFTSATNQQKISSGIDMVQSIVAGAETYRLQNGTYSGVSLDNIKAAMSLKDILSPWGGVVAVASTGSNSYTINIPTVPGYACTPLVKAVTQNAKITTDSTCAAGTAEGAVKFTVSA